MLPMHHSLAPLEFDAPGKLLLYFFFFNHHFRGAWYDRKQGDTPLSVNSRINYKNLSLFQSDVNITDVLQSDYFDNFMSQLESTDSDCYAILTVYPIQGFDVVSDAAIQDLANRLIPVLNKGRRIFLRYGSEMNGILHFFSK